MSGCKERLRSAQPVGSVRACVHAVQCSGSEACVRLRLVAHLPAARGRNNTTHLRVHRRRQVLVQSIGVPLPVVLRLPEHPGRQPEVATVQPPVPLHHDLWHGRNARLTMPAPQVQPVRSGRRIPWEYLRELELGSGARERAGGWT